MKNATLMTGLLILSLVQSSAMAHQTTPPAAHLHVADYLVSYGAVCIVLFALVVYLKMRSLRKRWPVAKR